MASAESRAEVRRSLQSPSFACEYLEAVYGSGRLSCNSWKPDGLPSSIPGMSYLGVDLYKAADSETCGNHIDQLYTQQAGGPGTSH